MHALPTPSGKGSRKAHKWVREGRKHREVGRWVAWKEDRILGGGAGVQRRGQEPCHHPQKTWNWLFVGLLVDWLEKT